MKISKFCFYLFTIIILLHQNLAYAHKASDSFLYLDLRNNKVALQLDLALRDLDYLFFLDSNNDGKITWKEIVSKQEIINQYVRKQLAILQEGKTCPSTINANNELSKHSDGTYLVYRLDFNCLENISPAKKTILQYELFFAFDKQHRGLFSINSANKKYFGIFTPDNLQENLSSSSPNRNNKILEFLKEGVHHIWTGYDHLLFLFSLLLPSVLVLGQGQIQAVKTFKTAFTNLIKVVTAFTLSHSITLSLAALEIFKLPSDFVESTIALSIVVVAINNIKPIIFQAHRAWLIAFFFGLIHGFGFAGVLSELGLDKADLVWTLLSFNLGVELGQLAVVSVVFPIIFYIRNTKFYKNYFYEYGSLAIIIIALRWFYLRAF